MTKKIGDKRVLGVKSTKATKDVEETKSVGASNTVKGTEAVSGTKGVQRASSVGRVSRSTSVASRSGGRKITAKEREELFRTVREEAERLCADGIIPKKRKELVKSAVIMAIDTVLIDEDES